MSTGPLDGVRVLEVASHAFVPAGTAVLAEWGAEVLKVEHPLTGDPYRGLVTAGLHRSFHGVDVSVECANRSKLSLGIDMTTDEGRDVVLRLARDCDIFVTSFRSATLERLRLGISELRAVNPTIIYGRATGYGSDGPDAGVGAYDHAAYWARSGIAHRMAERTGGEPQPPPPAFGDYAASLAVAAGLSAALYRRRVDGEGSIVDVSLLATGMWQLQVEVVDGALGPSGSPRPMDRAEVPNPLVNHYRTSDDRWLMLVMVASDRHWTNFCEVIGRSDLAVDPRFADADARRANSRACIAELDRVFAARDFDEWCLVLEGATGEWAPVVRPADVGSDRQVMANEFIGHSTLGDGTPFPLVRSPVRFDGVFAEPTRAPEVGEHTELTLQRFGYSWDEISALKSCGAII